MKQALALCALLLAGCIYNEQFDQAAVVPVMMDRAAMEASVGIEPARPIKAAGPTAMFGTVMYISERYEGIHIVDISNPSNPQKLGFLKLPGHFHLTVADGLLIADNSADLVSFDLTDPRKPVLRERVRDALSIPPAPHLYHRDDDFRQPLGHNVVVGYRDTILQYR